MNSTSQAGPPSSRRRRPLNPFQRAHRKAQALLTTRKRAESLLEDGYRFVPVAGVPGRLGVLKPGAAVATYEIDLWYSATGRRWQYCCSCPLFKGLARDPHSVPECKHGDRALAEFLKALELVNHVCPPAPTEPAAATVTGRADSHDGAVGGIHGLLWRRCRNENASLHGESRGNRR